ncbi:MAG: polysaccharide deacetylase family protein [Clostridia bacterium]|nr:polysaccharide deacetylase family protein [Clostridia bacterium]
MAHLKKILCLMVAALVIMSTGMLPVKTGQAYAAASGVPGTPSLSHNNWDNDGNYTIAMNLWWGNNGTSWKLYENDQPIYESNLTDNTPNQQTAEKSFNGKSEGIYTYKCELVNSYGKTVSSVITVTVQGVANTPTPVTTSTPTPTGTNFPTDTPTQTSTSTTGPATITPTPTPTTGSLTTVCTWKDNKKCAYTPTYDDTFLIGSQEKVEVLHKKYGVKGTIFWNTGDAYDSRWPRLKMILDEGYLDIGAHTVNHPDLTQKTEQEIEYELSNSKRILEEKTGFKCETMAYPYFEHNSKVQQIAAKYYISARGGGMKEGALLESTNPENFYALKSYINLGVGGNNGPQSTLEMMNGWLDDAIRQGAWMIVTNHGVDGEGWEPSPLDKMDKHYAYVQTKNADVWSEGMAEVTKYIKERQSAAVSTVSASDEQTVISLSDTLDNAVFDYPLTLKTKVDSSWNSVTVTQGNITSTKLAAVEGTEKFIYYDAIPDKGQITIHKVN